MSKAIKYQQVTSERSMFIGDIHFPKQDNKALELVKSFMRWFKPDIIFLIGDILDVYPLSSFDKDPTKILTLQEEINQAIKFLREIRRINPDAKMVFLEGNHEERLSRYKKKHPEISSLGYFSVSELLQLEEFDIEFFTYNTPIVYRDHIVEHGNMVRSKSAYSANGQMMKRNMSGISGHTHRLGVSHWSSAAGHMYWLENGCLCDLEAEYISGIPDWQLGFSVGNYYKEADRLYIENVPIDNYKIIYKDVMFSL